MTILFVSSEGLMCPFNESLIISSKPSLFETITDLANSKPDIKISSQFKILSLIPFLPSYLSDAVRQYYNKKIHRVQSSTISKLS